MARDRLAALRAQQQSDYGRERPAAGEQPAPPSAGDAYEMAPPSHTTPPPAGDAMTAFYAEVGAIQDGLRTLNDNVSRIADMRARALGSPDDAARATQQFDSLVEETRTLADQLKARIRVLQQKAGTGRDAQIHKQQTGLVRQKFIEAIHNYQQIELQYRAKYRQRMERQFRIVKPDATPEEVTAVVNDGQADQIFTQVLQESTRYRESRTAYREVQARQEDIVQIEKTLGDLDQLFKDMSLLVEQQGETIDAIETTAANVEHDAEAGLSHTQKAVISARAARRKRWICFIIILIILAVVAIVVGITVPKK